MENHKKPDLEGETLDHASYLISDIDSEGLTQNQFDEKYGRVSKEKKTCSEAVRDWCKSKCSCSKECCAKFGTSELPVIDVVRTYKFKEYILGDIFSGVSLGTLNIPQGMGYALLGTIAPIYGIYTSIWVPMLYILFGTSRHIAMGTMALSSLIVADVIQRETIGLQAQIDAVGAAGNDTSALEQELKLESENIFVLLTLLCGVCSFLMGFFRLGMFADYIGDAFLAGFLAGANIRVLTSQLLQMFQVKVHPHVGPLSLIYTLVDLFSNIRLANVASVVISLISLVIILVVKYGINERFKSKLKVPIPIDIIVIVIGTIVCYFGEFEAKYGVRIIKEIPTGMPMPVVPQIQRTSLAFITDAIVLVLIGFIIGFIMAKIFSQKYRYKLDANQELKAMGMCNILSSFFLCLPSSASPPRCFIMEQTGGKTQFANVLSGAIVMIFMFFAGPLLEPMPVCVLNAMIIAGSVPIFAYYKTAYIFFKTNRYDFAIFAVTWLSLIFLTLNYGIMIGIGFSIVTVVYRTQQANTSVLSPVVDHTALVNPDKYSKSLRDIGTDTKIFQFSGPLYFATTTMFREKLFEATVNPVLLQQVVEMKIREDEKGIEMKPNGVDGNDADVPESPDRELDATDVNLSTPLTRRKSAPASKSMNNNAQLQKVIIDASAIGFVDVGGAKLLARLRGMYSGGGVDFIVAGCNEEVREQLEKIVDCKDLRDKGICPTVQDAILL